jgi:PAS domain S-box-containing protein
MEEKKRILLVEDEPSTILNVTQQLKRFGYEVIDLNTGEKAVEFVTRDVGVDLILMDILLGAGIDGAEAAKQIAAKQDIPIVFLSSHSDRETVAKVHGLTRYGYVLKNSDEFVLQSSIEMAFELFNAKEQWKNELLERKRTEEGLRKSEERFRAFFKNAPLGYQSLDFDGNVIDVNEQWSTTLGYTREEVIGKWFGDFLAPAYRDAFRKRFPIFKERGRIHSEFEMVHKNGNSLFIAFEGKIGYQLNGEFKQTHCILQDITDRMRVEENLRESEEKYRGLVENSPDAIAIYVDGNIVFVNNECVRVMRADQKEALLGKSVMDFVHPDSRKRVTQRMVEVAVEGKPLPAEKEKFIRFDGTMVDVEVKAMPVSFDRRPAIQIIVRDITDRMQTEENLRRIEARLRRSEKMEAVGQLAGGIAHDFNNVLGGIIGFTELSMNYAERDSVLEKNLLRVLKAADRAKHLVMQILTFSRQGNSQKSITPIRPIIHEVMDLLRASIPSSVIIKFDLDRETKPVLADSTEIHQALLNLSTNAVHAMDRRGTLTIRLYSTRLDREMYGQAGEIPPGDYTVIEIADTGCGMDATTLSKCFEPFFTTKAIGDGTGMGLSVVLGIVQSHGGDLEVESARGMGTVIKIYLPAAEASVTETDTENARVRLSGSERILFVDDEQMLLEMAENMLTSLGYAFTGMSNSADALHYLRENDAAIDILITDQTMPTMTGVELAKEALKIRKDLPIILCTGYSREINPEKAAAIGIKQIMMKPYRSHEIGKSIREVLDNTKKASQT